MKVSKQNAAISLLLSLIVAGCAGGDITTREKGAGIGALGGAAAGGAIGAAVGHPGIGAAIGGALGLGTGALIGDQLQGQENRQKEQQKSIDQQRAEIDKNRALIDELKKRNIDARETSRGVMVNLPSVNFEFDSADLTRDGRDKVDQIANIIRRDAPNRRVTVEGHASRESASAGSLQPTAIRTTRQHRGRRAGARRREWPKYFITGSRHPRAGGKQRQRKRPPAKPPGRSHYRELVCAEARLGAGAQAFDVAVMT